MAATPYVIMKDNQLAGDLNAPLDFPDVWYPHRVGATCNEATTNTTILAPTFFSASNLATGTRQAGGLSGVPVPAANKLFPVEGAANIWVRAAIDKAQVNLSAATFVMLILGLKQGSDGTALQQYIQPYRVFQATCTGSGPSLANVNPLTLAAVATTTFYTIGTMALPDTTSFPTARIFDSGNGYAAIGNFDPLGADYLWCVCASQSVSATLAEVSFARGKS